MPRSRKDNLKNSNPECWSLVPESRLTVDMFKRSCEALMREQHHTRLLQAEMTRLEKINETLARTLKRATDINQTVMAELVGVNNVKIQVEKTNSELSLKLAKSNGAREELEQIYQATLTELMHANTMIDDHIITETPIDESSDIWTSLDIEFEY